MAKAVARGAAAAESEVLALAGRQHGLVTRGQLIALGLTRRTVARRVRQLRLRPIHRGVYLIGATLPPWGLEMAAVLACGARSVLSHGTAARVWAPALEAQPGATTVEIIVPPTGSGHRTGVRAYRIASLHPSEVRRQHEMPVTSPARTALDLAATFGRAGETRRLEQLVATLLDLRLTTEAELRTVIDRHASAQGARLLRLLLACPPALTRSQAEELLLRLIRNARLPLPRFNARAVGLEVDCLWKSERLVVEVDGLAWHSSRTRWERDRAREGALTAAGFTVLRMTWRQLTEEPDAVVARIAYTLGRLAAR